MKSRIEGIEYLRAIMSVFIVAWHMRMAGKSLIFSKDKYLEHIFTMSDFVNFHILLIAVPSFIFMSIFLYASEGDGELMPKKRLKRIFPLLTFWPMVLILYQSGYQGLIGIIPNSLADFCYTTLRAGNTLYYFFVSLLVCTFISHHFMKFSQRIQIVASLLSVIWLAFLPALTKLTGFYPLSAYWNPLNFISLSFAAVFLAQNQKTILENRKIVILSSISLSILFSIFEWKYSVGNIFFLGQGYAIPAYTRTSLVFIVFAVFMIALDPGIKANSIIRFMAKYSLALYCIHPFLMEPASRLAAIVVQSKAGGKYLSFLFVIAFSYFIAMVLKRFYLREEILV